MLRKAVSDPAGQRAVGAAGPPETTRPAGTTLAEARARGRVRGTCALLGPAFVAAIAYVDPGNFATNFSGGARFGYTLLWVIVAANLLGMLMQTLSAKLGLATGDNLPELSRRHFGRRTVLVLWAQAEVVAMATDLAEVIGGAIALNLLFGLPLLVGAAVTGAASFAVLALQTRGYRRFELTIGGLLAVILVGFLGETLEIHISPTAAAAGLVPTLSGSGSVMVAAGILGATVMPHVIYLHSALTQDRIVARSAADKRQLLRYQRIDVVIAMGLAGAVNAAMLAVAAALFHGREGEHRGDSLVGVHTALNRLVSAPAATLFAVALLAAGLASSGVGTYAGQVVMQGYLRRRIPLGLRRGLTLAPALAVLAGGLDATRALVLSQVVLSFGIPFAVIPLVRLTARSDVMGELANRRSTSVTAVAAVVLIVALNALLVAQELR